MPVIARSDLIYQEAPGRPARGLSCRIASNVELALVDLRANGLYGFSRSMND